MPVQSIAAHGLSLPTHARNPLILLILVTLSV